MSAEHCHLQMGESSFGLAICEKVSHLDFLLGGSRAECRCALTGGLPHVGPGRLGMYSVPPPSSQWRVSQGSHARNWDLTSLVALADKALNSY